MAGSSVWHSLIIANVTRVLGNQLEGSPCRVYSGDLRVRFKRKRHYAYPDLTVICDRPQIDADDPSGETVINPKLVVDVLSPSTESYNRKQKFDLLRELESFQEYVLVSQDMARIENYFRNADGSWRLDFSVGLEATLRLRSISVEMLLTEIYSGVEFTPEAKA